MNAMAQALVDAGVVNMSTTDDDGNHNAPQGDLLDAAQQAENEDRDNQPEEVKKTFMRQVTQFGTDEGKGNNAKPSLYIATCNAAHAGAVTDGDEELIYTTYSRGRAKAKGLGWVEDKSAPQQVSKVKVFIRLGAMTTVSGPDLLVRVGNAINDRIRGGEKLVKSAGDILLTCARMQIGQPDEALGDDQIDEAFQKKEPDAKIEADYLGEILDKADKCRTSDELPISEESKVLLDTICTTLAERVKLLGGTTAQRKQLEAAIRKEEKAKAKADAARRAVADLRG